MSFLTLYVRHFILSKHIFVIKIIIILEMTRQVANPIIITSQNEMCNTLMHAHKLHFHAPFFIVIFVIMTWILVWLTSLRGNSGTQYWVGFFGQRLKSSATRVFVGVSTFVFPFYKMLFMKKLKSTWVFSFRGFFLLGFLKPD